MIRLILTIHLVVWLVSGYSQVYPDTLIVPQESINRYKNIGSDSCVHLPRKYSSYQGPITDINGYLYNTSSQDTIHIVDILDGQLLPSNYTISLPSNTYLTDGSIKVQPGASKAVEVIRISQATCSGVNDLIIDTRIAFKQKYRDKWKEHHRFKNRAIIRVSNSSHISVDSCILRRIYGDGIMIANTRRSNFRGNHIEDAWTHGGSGGTQGYGIDVIGRTCIDNLIEGNTAIGTRHGIVVQDWAGWNVAGYNSVHDSYALKKWLWFTFKDRTYTFDITIHGDSAHHNLIEGNTVDHRIYIDNEHSSNDIGNILYRNNAGNKIQIDGNSSGYNYGQYMIANDAPKVKCYAQGTKIVNNTEGNSHVDYIPLLNEQVYDSLIGVTCYRKDSFFFSSNKTMSLEEYQDINYNQRHPEFKVFPNPVYHGGKINLPKEYASVLLYTLQGQEVLSVHNTAHLMLANVPKGIYLVVAIDRGEKAPKLLSSKIIIY